MARDSSGPLTDAEIDELREEMDEQGADIRDALEAEGVDVSSWNDRAEARTDGGED